MDGCTFLILVFMAIPASNTLTKIYDDTEGDINIQVVGYQWKWQYKYLEDDIDFFQNLTTDWDEIYNKTPKGEFYLEEVDEAVVIPVGKKDKIFNYCKRCYSFLVDA